MERENGKRYSKCVKKSLLIMVLLVSLLPLFSVSFDKNPDFSSPEITLLKTEEELKDFPLSKSLSVNEKNYYEQIDVYLYTGGPGSIVWENFGHSAIIIERNNGSAPIMFDYGVFQFDSSFFKNFALGKLYYLGMASYATRRIDSLIEDDRSASFVKLELTPLQKKNLISYLTFTTSDGNDTYLYDYYFDNCATRIRDAYNIVTDGQFGNWAEKQESKETLRSLSVRYLSRSSFPVAWAVNYLLGPKVDNRITLWQETFIPDILENAISEFEDSPVLYSYKSAERKPTPGYYPFNLYSLLFALAVGITILLSQISPRYISWFFDLILALFYLVLFILSSVLLFFMCASIHTITFSNANVVIISPLIIILSVCHFIAIFKSGKRIFLSRFSFFSLLFVLMLLIFKGTLISYLKQDNFAYYFMALSIYLFESLPYIRKLTGKRKEQRVS